MSPGTSTHCDQALQVVHLASGISSVQRGSRDKAQRRKTANVDLSETPLVPARFLCVVGITVVHWSVKTAPTFHFIKIDSRTLDTTV